MPTIRELQQFAATPMARYESRAAAARPARIGLYCAAGLLDLAAGTLLLLMLSPRDPEDDLASFSASVPVAGALVLLAVLVLLSMIWAIGSSAAAIAGERERGTLEALLLTPLDRRALLCRSEGRRMKAEGRGKAEGRRKKDETRGQAGRALPFCLHPSYFCLPLLPSSFVLHPSSVAAVAIWAILFYQMHAAAAAGLWFSSKYQRVWTASLVTYLAIIGPTVLLLGCGGIVSLAWPMVLGPALGLRPV